MYSGSPEFESQSWLTLSCASPVPSLFKAGLDSDLQVSFKLTFLLSEAAWTTLEQQQLPGMAEISRAYLPILDSKLPKESPG